MSGREAHATEADRVISTLPGGDTLGEAYAYAQTHALLAIAEQLRISNLIALAESESPTLGEPAYRATEALARWIRTTNEGVGSDHWALRPNIAAALGIEAES